MDILHRNRPGIERHLARQLVSRFWKHVGRADFESMFLLAVHFICKTMLEQCCKDKESAKSSAYLLCMLTKTITAKCRKECFTGSADFNSALCRAVLNTLFKNFENCTNLAMAESISVLFAEFHNYGVVSIQDMREKEKEEGDLQDGDLDGTFEKP